MNRMPHGLRFFVDTHSESSDKTAQITAADH